VGVDSIVEVFSASANCWYVGRVMHEGNGVLTVLFYLEDGTPKNKSMYRIDQNLALLGTHLSHHLPPGFQVKSSQSRPGQCVYFDATSGVKYASPELAWRVHFERLLKQPAGMDTVCEADVGSLQRRTLTIAELMASSGTPLPVQPAAPPARMAPMDGTDRGPYAKRDAPGNKAPLPSFGDARTSQSAYLGYMGSTGFVPPDDQVGGVLLGRTPPPPVRVANPMMEAWNKDPFSEWRR